MIIRKPYAFLIKNFRLIHGLLFIMILYLTIKSINIYSFFSDYVANGFYSSNGNLQNEYINYFLFTVNILAIIVSFIMFYLLLIKKKSNKIYLVIFFYYIILFVYFIYMFSVFKGLNTKAMSIDVQKLMLDISIIIALPNIVFLFIVFGRALGFNLKQFDFKKDLEELQIDASDNEEIEITFGNDNYKIARYFRKVLRLTKYFILENKIFVIGCASVFALIISLTIYTKLNVYKVSYVENQAFIANSLKFKVLESFETSRDINNYTISSGKSFILAKVEITNEMSAERLLERDVFKLELNKVQYDPSFTLGSKFIDFGEVYAPSSIRAGETKIVFVIFEINSDRTTNNYLLKIKNTVSNVTNIDSTYREIIIKPKKIDNISDKGKYKLGETITLDNLIFKSTSVTVEDYEINDTFTEDWSYCTNSGVCKKNAKYTIFPETANKASVSVLKLTSKFEYLDKDANSEIKKKVKYSSDLFSYYGFVNYTYLGETKTAKIKKISDSDFNPDNYAYFEVPSQLVNSNKIDLILTIRDSKYTFNLK